MVEEQKAQGEDQKVSTESSNDGNKPTTSTLIESANKVAERIEAANKRAEEILKRQEDLEARRRLGGSTTGAPQEEPKKEISNKDYAKQVLSGKLE